MAGQDGKKSILDTFRGKLQPIGDFPWGVHIDSDGRHVHIPFYPDPDQRLYVNKTVRRLLSDRRNLIIRRHLCKNEHLMGVTVTICTPEMANSRREKYLLYLQTEKGKEERRLFHHATARRKKNEKRRAIRSTMGEDQWQAHVAAEKAERLERQRQRNAASVPHSSPPHSSPPHSSPPLSGNTRAVSRSASSHPASSHQSSGSNSSRPPARDHPLEELGQPASHHPSMGIWGKCLFSECNQNTTDLLGTM
jgi:hypothetical protein